MSIRSAVLAIVAAIAIATPGHAAEWPTRLVRFVVPFTAGGATDVLTRLLCQRLSTELNVPFIVENRAAPAAMSAARPSPARRTTATRS